MVLQNTLICSFVFTLITETHSHGQGLIRYVSSKYSVLELYIHIDYKDTFSYSHSVTMRNKIKKSSFPNTVELFQIKCWLSCVVKYYIYLSLGAGSLSTGGSWYLSLKVIHISQRFHPHTPCRSHCTHSLSWCENHQLHSHSTQSVIRQPYRSVLNSWLPRDCHPVSIISLLIDNFVNNY